MVTRQLSPEIVSLIHHVSLNESGWWRKATSQVFLGVLWKRTAPISRDVFQADLLKELGHNISEETFVAQLKLLTAQGLIVEAPNGTIRLAEATRRTLHTANQSTIAERDECLVSFTSSCKKHVEGLDPEKVWDSFRKGLATTVRLSGANLYHLLGDGNLERDKDWLTAFFKDFDKGHREGLRKVAADFFAPGNQPCRNQVLRMMSAQFFAEASQLSDATIKALEGDKKMRVIRVVLDTNFVFSVLDLHDNPSDGSALSLIALAGQSKSYLDIKFYVLPSTIDEAKHVLADQLRAVERIRTTGAMARAALTQALSGIARRYFSAAAASDGLSPAEYFKPYIEDLRTILIDKGIAVLEAHPAIFNQRQDVVDDVLIEQEWEEQNIPEHRRKSYETLLHDVVLWHAVSDRRSSYVDSPFEVEYWAVSIDWRLIGFDRKKRESGVNKLPVVLHPNSLVQLVQFWVPRSAEMDASLIDSLSLPLYFQSFDIEDERATIKVLEAISRYENQADISEATITKILANQALRARLRESTAANDVVFELVRDEILAEHRLTIEKLGAAESSIQALNINLTAERKMREEVAQNLAAASEKIDNIQSGASLITLEKTALSEELDAATRKVAIAEGKVIELADTQTRIKTELMKSRFVTRFVFLPLFFSVVLAAIVVANGGGLNLAGYRKVMAVALAFSVPVLISCWLIRLLPRLWAGLETWWLPKSMKLAGWASIGLVLLTMQAVFQDYVVHKFNKLTGSESSTDAQVNDK
jgi:hypothetical protein